jgi:hypothetical protein
MMSGVHLAAGPCYYLSEFLIKCGMVPVNFQLLIMRIRIFEVAEVKEDWSIFGCPRL